MEECNEVAHAASKCIRFNPDDHHPMRATNNIDDLQRELRDLMTVLWMLEEEIKFEFNKDISQPKLSRMEEYMKYSKDKGILE
jgi:NTP pyrophosphatase (non-canonical NTP hydrolase)